MRRAIVDVDGTLVDLHKPLHATLRRLYPDIPDFYMVTEDWNWYKNYLTKKQFYAVVDLMHENQWREPALPGAKELFDLLNKYNYEVVVASHRQHNTAHNLAEWLIKNELRPFSGVFTNHNKLQLIQSKDSLVIDDAPETIIAADRVGCNVKYLAWPWNRNLPGERYADLYQLMGAIQYAGIR